MMCVNVGPEGVKQTINVIWTGTRKWESNYCQGKQKQTSADFDVVDVAIVKDYWRHL